MNWLPEFVRELRLLQGGRFYTIIVVVVVLLVVVGRGGLLSFL